MKMFGIIVFLLLTLASMSSAGEKDPQYFCGRKLAQTMAVVCDKFYTMKKSYANDLDYSAQGWVQATRAMQMGDRGKRGVVDDCCYQPCSIDYLMYYC